MMRLSLVDTLRVPWKPVNLHNIVSKACLDQSGLADLVLGSEAIRTQIFSFPRPPALTQFFKWVWEWISFHLHLDSRTLVIEIYRVETLFGGKTYGDLAPDDINIHDLLHEILEAMGMRPLILTEALRLGRIKQFRYPHALFAFGSAEKVGGKDKLRKVPGIWLSSCLKKTRAAEAVRRKSDRAQIERVRGVKSRHLPIAYARSGRAICSDLIDAHNLNGKYVLITPLQKK